METFVFICGFSGHGPKYDIFNSGAFAFKPGGLGQTSSPLYGDIFLRSDYEVGDGVSSILRPMKLAMLLV